MTALQWSLAGVVLLGSFLGWVAPGNEELAQLALLLAVLSTVLTVNVALEAIRTRLLGKLILVGSTFIMFWTGAASAALGEPPFGVPGLLLVDNFQFEPSAVRLALAYISLFQLCVLAGYAIDPRLTGLSRWFSLRADRTETPARILRYLLAAAAWLPLVLALRYQWGAIVGFLLAMRSSTDPLADTGYLHYLQFLALYGTSLLLAEGLFVRKAGRWRPVLAGVVGMLPLIMGGARHLWMYIALPFCVLSLQNLRGLSRHRTALRFVVALVALVGIAQLQLSIRQGGLEGYRPRTMVAPELDVTGQFTALLYAIHLVPERHDYFMEPAEPYFLIHWIPRKVWPGKPVMQAWRYYNDAYTQGHMFNVTPSIIGQYHLSWGLPGIVLIGVWLGFLATVADRLLRALDLRRQIAAAVTIGMLYAFVAASFRFYSPVYFTYFAFAFLGMLLVTGRREADPAAASSARPRAAVPAGA